MKPLALSRTKVGSGQFQKAAGRWPEGQLYHVVEGNCRHHEGSGIG
jgi:hypothetical protein